MESSFTIYSGIGQSLNQFICMLIVSYFIEIFAIFEHLIRVSENEIDKLFRILLICDINFGKKINQGLINHERLVIFVLEAEFFDEEKVQFFIAHLSPVEPNLNGHKILERSKKINELTVGLLSDSLIDFLTTGKLNQEQKDFRFLDNSMNQVPVFINNVSRLVALE